MENKFKVGDEVVVVENEHHDRYSFYLAGSAGVVTKAIRGSYRVELFDVVDAHPDERKTLDIELDWLAENGGYNNEDLEFSPEPLDKGDDGFESVF